MNKQTRRFTELVEALEVPGANVAAAAALRDYGAEAVEPLCRALDNTNPSVRAAAAESLGIIGDPRAVEPLRAALKSCMGGRSAREYVRSGVFTLAWLFAGYFLVLAFFLAGDGAIKNIILTCSIVGFLGIAGLCIEVKNRRTESKLVGTIAEALARIAEAAPRAELLQLVPELQAIAADRVQQELETRRVSRHAAQRILRATADLKDLPRPATGPALDPAVLPRPAEALEPDARALPRVE